MQFWNRRTAPEGTPGVVKGVTQDDTPQGGGESQASNGAGEGTTKASDTPKALTAEDVQRMMSDTLAGLLAQQQQHRDPAPALRAPEPPLPALPPEVSEDDIATAYEEGDYKKAAKLQKQQRERDHTVFQREVERLRHDGAAAIGDLAEQTVIAALPEYGRFRGEIDSFLGNFPEALRKDQNVRKAVYNMVRGQHLDEIVGERLEQEKRQSRQAATQDKADAGRQAAPEPQTQFSDADFAALREVGTTKEEFAKKLGYKSWAAYEKMASDYNSKPVHKWRVRGA